MTMWINSDQSGTRMFTLYILVHFGTQLFQITRCYSAMLTWIAHCFVMFCARCVSMHSRMHASESFTAMSWFWPSHLKAKNWVSYAPQGIAFASGMTGCSWSHSRFGQRATARDNIHGLSRWKALRSSISLSPSLSNLNLSRRLQSKETVWLSGSNCTSSALTSLGSVVDSEVPSCLLESA